MKLKISVALVCLLLAHPAAAQSVKALAREYIALPAVQDTFLDAQSPAFASSALAGELPPGAKMSPAKKAAVAKAVTRHLTKIRPAIEKAMIESAARTYTAEELKAMIAFAKTEAGASSIRKGPMFMLQFSSEMAPTRRRTEEALRSEVMNILLQ